MNNGTTQGVLRTGELETSRLGTGRLRKDGELGKWRLMIALYGTIGHWPLQWPLPKKQVLLRDNNA